MSSIVDAVQFLESDIDKIQNELLDMLNNSGRSWKKILGSDPHLIINTLEGDHRANINDFIIKDAKGKLYTCEHDIFKATYEPILSLI